MFLWKDTIEDLPKDKIESVSLDVNKKTHLKFLPLY